MMKKLLLLLFLFSCTSINLSKKNETSAINFNDNLSFDDFKKKLIQYAKTNPYPDISE
tara:strand:+ start:128 stop:301 length:174 start_codon:yes stop_codon:yes gene_type:complete